MTGYDLCKRAFVLLGYSDADGRIAGEDGLLKRAEDVLGEICGDLEVVPPSCLTDPVSAPPAALETIPYGVAMLLSFGADDGTKNRMFTSLYNQKRATVKGRITKIGDALPTDDGGAI